MALLAVDTPLRHANIVGAGVLRFIILNAIRGVVLVQEMSGSSDTGNSDSRKAAMLSELGGCYHADIPRLRHQINRAKSEQDFARIQKKVAASQDFVGWRADNLPKPTFPEQLPVCARASEIAEAIRDNQVVIIAGATGSGKTTQIPKICLEMGRGVNGIIGCTQPRRVAAVSVAERVAQELETPLGDAVGYQVRFEQRLKRETYIKFMTDGVLLSETRSDPDLLAYDTLIIDEAHERSLNIDFILGYVKRLLSRRPELKVIVSSATIEVERFCDFFDGAPALEVEGRTYPVDIIYSPCEEDDADLPVVVGHTADNLYREFGMGDTLVFMTGEQDIRETVAHLEKKFQGRAEVLPLYSRLTPAEQRMVFHPGSKTRIIVSTNVAETSVTVPRIRYVIDSGLARIKRYNPRTQVERLQIEAISQASANQRSGRCGRVQAGICVRLYDQKEFSLRPEYTDPEIKRSSLAGVILQMSLLRLGRVDDFPFIEPPMPTLIRSGYDELEEIGAIDSERRLTRDGKAIAALPLEPRFGRMLLTAYREGCLEEAVVVVAALSVQDPRLRPVERRDEADRAHKKYRDKYSDFKSWLHLWRELEKQRKELGSNNRYNKWCRDNFLSYLRLREWNNTVRQLTELMERTRLPKLERTEAANRKKRKFNPKTSLDDPQLHKSLLSGLLSRCGVYHEEDKDYRGSRGTKFHIWPGSGLAGSKTKWIMSAEIVETTRPFARCAAAVEIDWLEDVGYHLLKYSYSEPFFDERGGCVRAYMNATLYGLPVVEKRRVHYGPVDPHKSREVFILDGLVRRKLYSKLPFYRNNSRLINKLEDGQNKLRRSGLLIDEQGLYDFYASRLPENIYTLRALERYCQKEQNADKLMMSEGDVCLEPANGLGKSSFPEKMVVDNHSIALNYKFEPGHKDDGVTATLPLGILPNLTEDIFDWLVPGLLPQKISELLRLLPRRLRRELNSYSDITERASAEIGFGKGNLYRSLADFISKEYCVRVDAEDFSYDQLPPFLRMNFTVIDSSGKTVAGGRDLSELKERCAAKASDNFKQAPKKSFERRGITAWDFDLPQTVSLAGGAKGYPGLHDDKTSVSLKICQSPQEAERITLRGICRLASICLAPQISKIIKSLSVTQNALMQYAAIGGGQQQFNDEVIECSVLHLFTAFGTAPTNKQEFETFLEYLRTELYPCAYGVARAATESLEAMPAVLGQLQPARSDIKNQSISEMRSQLGRLIYPGFIRDAGVDNIKNIPRYLQAIVLRNERAQSFIQKDRKRAQEINPLWEQTLQAFATAQKKRLYLPQLLEYRWMLEEYAVSLFAQEVGTSGAVSLSSLNKLWKNIERELV